MQWYGIAIQKKCQFPLTGKDNSTSNTLDVKMGKPTSIHIRITDDAHLLSFL